MTAPTTKTDAITGWWRGVSLRAKVTGVTVAVLAIGLFATGIGAMAFLRSALIASTDSQIQQVVVTNAVSSLVTIDYDGIEKLEDASPTNYFVALYGGADNELLVVVGGQSPEPDFPLTYTLAEANQRGTEPFDLSDAATGAKFRASVAPLELPEAGYQTVVQMVALPLEPVDDVVNTYLGIFGVLAVITIIAGALATRGLVTLTFRSLSQVETTAQAITAGDFGQRLTDIEPQHTEVGKLKSAINAMLDRVDAAIGQRDASVRQMRRFIGDASHELRTPLVSVRGYAELYRMGAIRGDEDIAQAMERIEKEAIRMGVLVEDLLALARLDERHSLTITPVDLRPVARDASLDVRASAPQRTVTVVDTTSPDYAGPSPEGSQQTVRRSSTPHGTRRPSTPIARAGGATLSLLRRKPRPVPAVRAMENAGPDIPTVNPIDLTSAPLPAIAMPPIVLGDENRIRQVIANLVGNARRYTPEDSPIELAVGVDALAGMGWIAVVDHGEGIPEQIRDRIFERFWRADTSRARETGGSGLGLSIVASIVEALHGTVVVEETPGGGATFRVAFPLAQTRDAAEHLSIDTQPLPRMPSAES